MKTNYTEHTGIRGNIKHSFVASTSWASQKFPSHVLKWALTSLCFVSPVYGLLKLFSLLERCFKMWSICLCGCCISCVVHSSLG